MRRRRGLTNNRAAAIRRSARTASFSRWKPGPSPVRNSFTNWHRDCSGGSRRPSRTAAGGGGRRPGL